MKQSGSVFRGAVAFLILFVPMNAVLACSDGARVSTQSTSGKLQQAKSTPTVEFDAQRNLLRVTAQEQTMDQVLAAITTATKIHFTEYGSDCRQVNIQFDFLPLEMALAQVFKGRNYVLSRPTGQGNTRVWVLPVGDDNAPSPTEIMSLDFYTEFQGIPETERFAEQLKRAEPQLSAIKAAGSVKQTPREPVGLR